MAECFLAEDTSQWFVEALTNSKRTVRFDTLNKRLNTCHNMEGIHPRLLHIVYEMMLQ